MFRRISHHLPHFFSQHPTVQLEELAVSAGILDFAVSAVALFEPIYLYTLGYSLIEIMAFYVVVYAVYAFLIPLGGKALGRFGYERMILVSSISYVAYYLALFSIPAGQQYFWIAAVLFSIQKTFYWPAFHFDFVRNAKPGDVGREFSAVASASQLIAVIAPFVGGALVTIFGYQTLFLVIMGLIMLSNVPLFYTREVVVHEHLSYIGTFRRLYAAGSRRETLAYLGFGEELIMMTIWPIFIFIAVTSAVNVGSLVALASLAAVITTLVSGRLADSRRGPKAVLPVTTLFYSVVWAMRTLVVTPLQIFFGDSLGRIFKNAGFVPLISITYQRARKGDALAHVVFFEQALAIGKALTALLVMILLTIHPTFTAAFILAALLTQLYYFL